MNIKNSLSLLFSIYGSCFLAGCGGGSSATTAPNTSPPPLPLTITSSAPFAGTLQVPYGGSSDGFALAASGGKSPYAWSWAAASGSSLPPGLSISTKADGTGAIAGTPSSAGSYNVVVKVTDSESPIAQATANYMIAVYSAGTLSIISGAPPSGTVAKTYGGTFGIEMNHCLATFSGWSLDATGGTGGYHWSWSAAPGSSLPPGLAVGVETFTCGGSTRCCVTVSSPPLIHGTPTTTGTFQVIVTVTDSASPQAQAIANYTIAIRGATAAAAGKASMEVSSAQQHVRYKVIDVGTLGGPNSNTTLPFFEGLVAPSLSKTGIFAGQAETSIPDPFAPNCFNPDCYVTNAIKMHGGVTIDLGALSGPAGLSSATTWISDNGLIAGISLNGVIDPFTGTPATHGVVWKHDKIIDLGILDGGYESVAIEINSYGDIAGFANNAIPDPNSLAGLGSQTRAVVWRNGVIHDLGTLGGTDAVALYVNDLGQIVGESYTASSIPPPSLSCGDSPLTQHGFFWENGKMVDLDTLGGSCTFAYALNNRGQIVGQSTLAGDNTSHPFLWQKGAMKDLGALGGNYGYAGWLNDAGEVVGSASNQGEQALLAFLWKNGAISNLGTLNGDSCSVANAINSSGQVVGGSGVYLAPFFPACTDAVEHAVLWENGQALDLNLLVTPSSDLTLNEATSLNDRGEISGFGTLANGDTHAFVLIPCDANHLNLEGCDYNPVEAVSQLQFRPTQVTPTPTTSPAKLSLTEMMSRFRRSNGSRGRRSGAPTAMLNAGGELGAFNAASATTNIKPAPTNLTSFAFKRGFYDVVELSWIDHSTDADSYHVERCTGSTCTNFSEIAVTGGNATRYIDSMWPMHLTFRYRVRAHSPSGYSGYSNIRTQTTP